MSEEERPKRPREEEEEPTDATTTTTIDGAAAQSSETVQDIIPGESDAKKSKIHTDEDSPTTTTTTTDPAKDTGVESTPEETTEQVAVPATDKSETAATDATETTAETIAAATESTTTEKPETSSTTEESTVPADSAADIATATEAALATTSTTPATTTAPATTDNETSTQTLPKDPTPSGIPPPLEAPAPAPTTTAPAPAQSAPAAISGLPPADPSVQASVVNPNSVVEERGEVSSLYVGRVIGKGGEQIRDLQARSGCRIDVDQNVPPGHPRVITYRGTRKTVDFAKQLVHLLCQEHGKEQDLPLGEAAQKISIVPASSIGKIIGRGGEMIRELQSRSQAKIQIDHSGASGTDPQHRQVTLTGTQSAVTKAEEMIMFLVANPSMDAMQSITMLSEDKTQRGGVWGSGPPYPNLPNQGQNMMPGQTGSYGGQPGGDPYSAYGQSSATASSPYGTPSGGGGYGAVEMEIFPAAKMYMGRVIGQKGVTINDLQKRSGADIQINQDVPAGQDCQISIKGNRQAVDMVKQMLREIIEMGPNHPYAGGGGQHGGGGGGGGYGNGGGGGGYPPQQYHQQQGGYPPQSGGSGYGGYQQQPPAQQYYQQQPAYGQQQQQQPYGAQPSYGQTPAPYAQAPAPSHQYPPQQQQQQQQPYQQHAPYGGGGGGAYPPQQQVPAAPAASSWKTATAGDGQVYYYNEVSGETQWEKPAGML